MRFVAWFLAVMTLPFVPLALILWEPFRHLHFAAAGSLVIVPSVAIAFICLTRLFESAEQM
jgi:hypothetical protein